MVNCSNYRMGACMHGECAVGRPTCCIDEACGGPDGKGQGSVCMVRGSYKVADLRDYLNYYFRSRRVIYVIQPVKRVQAVTDRQTPDQQQAFLKNQKHDLTFDTVLKEALSNVDRVQSQALPDVR